MSSEELSETKRRLGLLEVRMREQELRLGRLVGILELLPIIAFLAFLVLVVLLALFRV